MTDELKPVRCGCGGEAHYEAYENYNFGSYIAHIMICDKCGMRTAEWPSETEAITAWNRAMGNRMELQTVKERTAKITTVEKPIEGSVRTISVMACENCDSVVSIFDKYCSGCGARLEWE